MLTDIYNRRLDYLRVSVTDKCNLRCIYCMPPGGVEFLPHEEVLRIEEFIHLIGVFAGFGVRKVRFTGGEPLVRKGFMAIVEQVRRNHPDMELCLTTNGILLDEALDGLRRFGVRKLNISLDTMSAERYRAITGRDEFDRVIGNIARAIGSRFFDLKINMVLHEESLVELDDYIKFFAGKNVTLRFIERMPFDDVYDAPRFVPSDRLVEYLRSRGDLMRNHDNDTSVAQMYNLRGTFGDIRIGVIPPMTHKFCSRCNRLRLTCDGMLKTCLHSPMEFDLKTALRKNEGDRPLNDIIAAAVHSKPEAHRLGDPLEAGDGCMAIVRNRQMSRTGG
ncbi:MAG TPA: GTP 3',8-cyclase MoaA [Spirochaetota bacterium]|nr:GTP 3',8-cyclase MoaA [Spirochaetota bacterium]